MSEDDGSLSTYGPEFATPHLHNTHLEVLQRLDIFFGILDFVFPQPIIVCMLEQNPITPSDIPEALAKIVTKEREIGGTHVRQINKSGSKLSIIDTQEKAGIVRNAELPANSMATWEFLHRYAHTLFPLAVAQKLFGVWERPQVAPILEKDGKSRAYYRDQKASAFSEMVGVDTLRLAEAKKIEDIIFEYKKTHPNALYFEGERWVDSLSYYLAKDLTQDVPEIGSDGKLMQLIEAYWDEFTKLNKDKLDSYQLSTRNLKRKQMDDDSKYISSLNLVETGHAIQHFLREKIKEVESQRTPEWKGQSVSDLLHLLLHLYQMSTQQSILWWLGISHGHLHLLNAVSRATQGKEAEKSPLETRIIDFDKASVSVEKLAHNSELLQYIDAEKVKTHIKDSQLNINLRLLFVMYLPFSQWDDEIINLIKSNPDKTVTDQIINLIWLKKLDTVADHELIKKITLLVYENEKQINKIKFLPAFEITSSFIVRQKNILRDTPEFSNAFLCLEDKFESIQLSELSDEQILLLLSVLYHKKTLFNLPLTNAQFSWIFDLTKKTDRVGEHAKSMLLSVINNESNHALEAILSNAAKGDLSSVELSKKLLFFAFSEDNLTDFVLHVLLRQKIDSQNLRNFAFSLFDFSTMTPEQIRVVTKQLGAPSQNAKLSPAADGDSPYSD